MALTPEEVRNKRFTPVRLREGYDMGEVDQFLDEVEAELERLHHENEDLRQKVAGAQRGEPARQPEVKAAPEPAKEPAPVPTPAALPAVTTSAEASTAATRLLEIATQNADQLVAEATDQAKQILGEARANGDRMENEARGRSARLESEARAKAEALDRETADRRGKLFGQLEQDKARLEHEVEELRTFERQNRSRLRSYFERQLRSLDDPAEGGAGEPAAQAVGQSSPRSLNSHKPTVVPGGSGSVDTQATSTPRLNALLDDDEESSL